VLPNQLQRAYLRDLGRGLGEGRGEGGEVPLHPGEKVDRSISRGYMAEVTVDVVEGANKDHVRRKNGGLELITA
jgi:hypothetical protein